MDLRQLALNHFRIWNAESCSHLQRLRCEYVSGVLWFVGRRLACRGAERMQGGVGRLELTLIGVAALVAQP